MIPREKVEELIEKWNTKSLELIAIAAHSEREFEESTDRNVQIRAGINKAAYGCVADTLRLVVADLKALLEST